MRIGVSVHRAFIHQVVLNIRISAMMVLSCKTCLHFSVILFISNLMSCCGHEHGAYMRNSNDNFNYRVNWMNSIDDHVRLSELAIPGTHQSSTFKSGFGDIVVTQALNFDQQLNYGVRFFDIAIRHISNEFALHYGIAYLGLYFGDFLTSVDNFLRNNPTETVLFRLREEYSCVGNTRHISETLQWYLNQRPNTYLRTDDRNINLGRARGKFIILSDNSEFDSFGLHYGLSNIQDKNHLVTNWDLYSKWESIKSQLENARTGDPNIFYFNYLSGSGGSFPYFVASGHSSPGTSAPRLATGLTTPGWQNSYPDFPRVDCFIGICTIAFEGTNILTLKKIQEYNANVRNQRRTIGIIVADFPGDDLISAIINNNAAHRRTCSVC